MDLDTVVQLHHRSRERVKERGEVFTTEQYIDQMLNILEEEKVNIWADDNTVFFEPTCGHGNFVIAILKRRFEAFFNKAKKQNDNRPALYAVANALNNLWAIDIDSENIIVCRSRVLKLALCFIEEKEEVTRSDLIHRNNDFIAHIISCIKWQIHENEALSALAEKEFFKEGASKTLLGQEWIKHHNHHPINFELSWCDYFHVCNQAKMLPIEFQRTKKVLNQVNSQRSLIT